MTNQPIPFPPRPSKRGRPAKTTQQRKEEGLRGHRALPELEPQPPVVGVGVQPGIGRPHNGSLPPPPDSLSELAAVLWTRVFCPAVVLMRVMTDVDWTALTVLCAEEARRLELEDYIQAEGMFYQVEDKLGNLHDRVRPQVKELRGAQDRVMGLLREFGMTPSSRPKVQMVPQGTGAGVGGEGEGKKAVNFFS